jgi:pimeloyl-ACP methyl ester carboxylesterase
MEIIGSGPPLVLVPGMQGRWEWMAPTVAELAARFTVITYSLCGEPGSPPLADSLDGDLAQLDAACRAGGPGPVTLVGVSFGGWIAVRYAAAHPDRVRAIVLASAPGPGFRPSPQQARWLARPVLSMPIFALTAPGRLLPELRNVFPTWRQRIAFAGRQGWLALRAPMSARRVARRVHVALAEDVADAARQVRVPTLLVTGEDGLDRIVPPASTRRYVDVIPDTRVARLDGTGHMGTVTRAAAFAALVGAFADAGAFADPGAAVATALDGREGAARRHQPPACAICRARRAAWRRASTSRGRRRAPWPSSRRRTRSSAGRCTIASSITRRRG